jgi:hypothetical protein
MGFTDAIWRNCFDAEDDATSAAKKLLFVLSAWDTKAR